MDLVIDAWNSLGSLTPLSIAILVAYCFVVFREL